MQMRYVEQAAEDGGVRSGSPRWAEAGIEGRTALFRDSDRMGLGKALILRGAEATMAPALLLGGLTSSTIGTGSALLRGDMAGAGRDWASVQLDLMAAGAMALGGRAGLAGRTSFAVGESLSVAEGFVAARLGNVEGAAQSRTYADFMKWSPNKAPDPGVPQLVDAIEGRFPGLVRQVEIPIHDVPPAGWNGPPPNITDLDIVLADGRVIQVKEGSGGKIVKQLGVSKDITGMEPIGFDANKLLYGDSAQGFKPGTVREATRQGYMIVNTVDDLLNHLGSIYRPR